MRKLARLLFGNLLVVGFLVSLINTIAIASIKIYDWFKPRQYVGSHVFPNDQGAERARTSTPTSTGATCRQTAISGLRLASGTV
jgi:hypothetical protein